MALEARLSGPERETVPQIRHCACQEESVFDCLRDPASLFYWNKKALRAFRNGFLCWQWIHPQDIKHLNGSSSA